MKVKFANKKETIEQLKTYFKKYVLSHNKVEEIILFGSYARDDYVPGSDADILLILKDSDEDRVGRIPEYLPVDAPLPIDIIPFTRQEFENEKNSNQLIRTVLKEGIKIYPQARH